MAKRSPWHSKCEEDGPYHDESTCDVGNNIEARCLAQGTGGRRKCKRCIEISG